MNLVLRTWLTLVFLLSAVFAYEVQLSSDGDQQQKCNGMYSEGNWGGSVSPYIMTLFYNQTFSDESDPIVSLIMFEWKDAGLIGQDDGTGYFEYVCNDFTLGKGYCAEDQIGEFIVQDGALNKSQSPIITKAVHLKEAPPITYDVTKTGYYCVWTLQYTEISYDAVVEFRNSYGELPAAQIPKLTFYGVLTIVYAVVAAYWAFLYVQNRHDILPVQNYITAIIVFLILEQLMTWGFYDYQNKHGYNAGTKAFMVVTAILNAGRNSFSFFLLLIVCMGYGVVKPSLGKTMWYVRALAITHFVFGVIYGITSLAITPDSAGPLVLLVIVPLAGSLTVFYVWTLNALSATMKDLLERKQSVKAMMYRRLWWCILLSIVVIFAFFFFNSLTFASRGDPDFVPNNWKSRWFILDGWLNLVYLFDICFVSYLWRPTANNLRFAMSDELAQDEEGGFEIASFGLSDSEDEEDGRPRPNGSKSAPQHDDDEELGGHGDLSPVPPRPMDDRRSLEGETIFAVGEDGDRWSDDEDGKDHSEREGLNAGR